MAGAKSGKVRKQASKLAETEGANAPQLQFVLADGFLSTKRPNLKKALPHLEKALADDELERVVETFRGVLGELRGSR